MDDETLIQELQTNGVVTARQLSEWQRASGLLAVLDAIGREGSTALVKVDGERAGGAFFTVVISGGRLGREEFFRKDGEDLRTLLREAIAFYRDAVWAKDQPA